MKKKILILLSLLTISINTNYLSIIQSKQQSYIPLIVRQNDEINKPKVGIDLGKGY